MSARNIRLLGMCLSTLTSRCAIENCIMSARNIRATAHAPCSQHTFNQNLEPKTDQFHGLYSTGDAIDFTSGRRAELKHDVICLRLVNSTWSIWSSRVSCQVFGWTWTERCDAVFKLRPFVHLHTESHYKTKQQQQQQPHWLLWTARLWTSHALCITFTCKILQYIP